VGAHLPESDDWIERQETDIARNAKELSIVSLESRYTARGLGDERLKKVLAWAQSQEPPELNLLAAVRRLIDIGLK
jgi:hypothetical protein